MGKGYEGLDSKYMLVYLLFSVAIICDLWEKSLFWLMFPEGESLMAGEAGGQSRELRANWEYKRGCDSLSLAPVKQGSTSQRIEAPPKQHHKWRPSDELCEPRRTFLIKPPYCNKRFKLNKF